MNSLIDVINQTGGMKDVDRLTYSNLFLSDIKKNYKPIVTFNQIEHSLPYESSRHSIKMGDHIGQRKLLLSEVQFLVKNTSKYIVYAGSAPGNKTLYLSMLFPDRIFILVDPNQFKLFLFPGKKNHRQEPHPDIVHITSKYPTKSNVYKTGNLNPDNITGKNMCSFIKENKYKIYIIEDFFTDKLAKKLKCLDHVFISDIRTNMYGDCPMDLDIIWNTSMMFNWIMIMRPTQSMIKFRAPYYNAGEFNHFKTNHHKHADDFNKSKQYGIDFVADYNNGILTMLNGEIYIQVWQGSKSSETRLHIKSPYITNKKGILTKKLQNLTDGKCKKLIIEYKDFENKLYYFNMINRGFAFHVNPHSSPKFGVGHCNDCAVECLIWDDYIKYSNSNKSVIAFLKDVDKLLYPRTLKKQHNDLLQKPLDVSLMKKILIQEIKKRNKKAASNKVPNLYKSSNRKIMDAINKK
jgi:hypothetical protein